MLTVRKRGEAVRFEDVKWETDNPSASNGPDGVNEIGKRKQANPAKHFSHLFNAYAKHVNDKYDRHGSLFQRPFKHKLVDNENYLRQAIIYTHNNPIHHGFVTKIEDWSYSSYETILVEKPTKVNRIEALTLFGDREEFIKFHQCALDEKLAEELE